MLAAAAQAAIWDIAYDIDGATTTSSNTTFNGDLSNFLIETFTGPERYAQALLVPDGVDNQIMVTGLTSAPEPSTWAMMLLGFAGLGYAGFRRSRQAVAMSV